MALSLLRRLQPGDAPTIDRGRQGKTVAFCQGSRREALDHHMSEARLAALWMRSSPRRAGQSGWHGVVSQGIEHLGCSTCRSGQAIDAWPRRPERRWTLDDGGRAVNGWRLSNLWLGPRGRALAVRPRTIYLRPDGSRDTRPEHVIVGERKPPWPLQQRRQALVSLLDRLQVTCRPTPPGSRPP